MDCSRDPSGRKFPPSDTCVIRLLQFSLSVPGDDLGDELPGCRVNVGQQGAVVGSTGQGIPVDFDEAGSRGGGRGHVVVGGRGCRVRPHLPLPLPHRSVSVAVGAPPQEEVREALCAGLGPGGPRPEEGRGRRRGRCRGGQRGSGVREGRGRGRGGLVEGGGVRAGGGPGNNRGREVGGRQMEGRGSREEGTSQLRVMTEQTQTNNRD